MGQPDSALVAATILKSCRNVLSNDMGENCARHPVTFCPLVRLKGCVMDRDEFGLAVLEHKDRVHTYAAWLLGDLEEARDVTQEALMRLWEHRRKIRDGAARTWLLRTSHNLCMDRLRRKGVLRSFAPEGLDCVAVDDATDPERSLALSELRAGIGAALSSLAPRDRSMVLMREVHGLSYEEMSDVLGVQPGALRVALHRARERLRRALIGAGVTV